MALIVKVLLARDKDIARISRIRFLNTRKVSNAKNTTDVNTIITKIQRTRGWGGGEGAKILFSAKFSSQGFVFNFL